MNNKLLLKVDYAGRIIIPKVIRNKFNIRPNDKLILCTNEKEIILKKDTIEIETIENKLDYLTDFLGINYLITKENIIISASDKYKNYIDRSVIFNLNINNEIKLSKDLEIEEVKKIKEEYFYFLYNNIYNIFVILDKNMSKEMVFSYLKLI